MVEGVIQQSCEGRSVSIADFEEVGQFIVEVFAYGKRGGWRWRGRNVLLHLNIVEFGPSIYGIADAAMYYFGRDPPELNQIESVYLIRLLPNPVKRHDKSYARNTVSKQQMNTYHRVLRTMNQRKRITDFELEEGLQQELEFHIGDAPLPVPRPPVRRYTVGTAPPMDDYDPADDLDMDYDDW